MTLHNLTPLKTHNALNIIKKAKQHNIFYFVLILLVYSNTSFSQEKREDSVTRTIKKITNYEEVLKDDIYITGKVTDVKSELPVINTTITIAETATSTKTDSNGLYKLNITAIPEHIDTLTLNYSAADYKKTTQLLERKKLTNMFNIVDVTMENNLPQLAENNKQTQKKDPLHEQVLNKVKNVFSKIRIK